jgi:hypothetical protein
MRHDSFGTNLLILFGLFFVHTFAGQLLAFMWSNYVVSRGTYYDTSGEIVFRALDLLAPFIVSFGVGAAARVYIASRKRFAWLVVLGTYVGVTHYASYRGIFRNAVLTYRVSAAIEAVVLALAVFAGAAVAAWRMRTAPPNSPLHRT